MEFRLLISEKCLEIHCIELTLDGTYLICTRFPEIKCRISRRYRNKKAKLKVWAKNIQIYLINRTIPIYLTEKWVYIPRNFTNEWQSLYLRSKRERPLENTVPQLLKLQNWRRSSKVMETIFEFHCKTVELSKDVCSS